jgi:hypothetical protein
MDVILSIVYELLQFVSYNFNVGDLYGGIQ